MQLARILIATASACGVSKASLHPLPAFQPHASPCVNDAEVTRRFSASAPSPLGGFATDLPVHRMASPTMSRTIGRVWMGQNIGSR
jgi:hypothetical protein